MTINRLPIIRHIRATIEMIRIERWYRAWASLGLLPVNRDRDEEIVRKIWRGEA